MGFGLVTLDQVANGFGEEDERCLPWERLMRHSMGARGSLNKRSARLNGYGLVPLQWY